MRHITGAEIVGAWDRGSSSKAANAGVHRVADPLEVGDVRHAVEAGVATVASGHFPLPIIGKLAAYPGTVG